MATLKDYAIDTIYETGFGQDSGDIRTGRDTISFFRPLIPGQSRPNLYQFDVGTGGAAANDVVLPLTVAAIDGLAVSGGESVTLSQGDVLNFGTVAAPEIVVINAISTVAQGADTAVPILPLIDARLAADSALSYALIPITFGGTGGSFDNASNIATATAKNSGLWDLKATTGRSGTTTLSGPMFANDRAVYEFQSLNRGGRNCYYESRYHPYIENTYIDDTSTVTISYGSGPGAEVATTTCVFKVNTDATEIVTAEVTLEAIGSTADYVILSTDNAPFAVI